MKMGKTKTDKNERKIKRTKNPSFSLPLDVLDVVDLGGARVGRVDADDLRFHF